MKQDGGSILSSILPALTKVASKVVPTLIKSILLGMATGVTSTLSSLGIDKIFGNGANFHNSRTGDLIKALAVIENELTKLPKKEKDKFDKVMMTGNGETGGILSAQLASIGLPLVLRALSGQGLHNTPYDTSSYKTHRKKIPIPNQNEPILKPEGTALINKKWEPYNPPPFYDDHEIQGIGLKKRSKNHGQGIIFGKDSLFKNVPLLNILF